MEEKKKVSLDEFTRTYPTLCMIAWIKELESMDRFGRKHQIMRLTQERGWYRMKSKKTSTLKLIIVFF